MGDLAAEFRRAALRASAALVALALLASGCTTSLSQWWHNGWKVGPQYCTPGAPSAENKPKDNSATNKGKFAAHGIFITR